MTLTRAFALFLTIALAGVLLHADPRSGAATAVHLTAISARVTSKGASLVIEATEPVAYVATQPDALTVVVEFRNVGADGVSNNFVANAKSPIAAVAVEQLVARVHDVGPVVGALDHRDESAAALQNAAKRNVRRRHGRGSVAFAQRGALLDPRAEKVHERIATARRVVRVGFGRCRRRRLLSGRRGRCRGRRRLRRRRHLGGGQRREHREERESWHR